MLSWGFGFGYHLWLNIFVVPFLSLDPIPLKSLEGVDIMSILVFRHLNGWELDYLIVLHRVRLALSLHLSLAEPDPYRGGGGLAPRDYLHLETRQIIYLYIMGFMQLN